MAIAHTQPKTILFLGATGGCALSALRQALQAKQTCLALVRTPSKLNALLTPEEQSQVHIHQGNAHDLSAIRRVLVNPSRPNALVDYIVSSIGNPVSWEGMRNLDAEVCRKGLTILLQAIAELRDESLTGNPHIIALSSTGLSSFHRDIPLAMVPLYKAILAVPHRDKKAMEDALIRSTETWTIVRASALTDGIGGKTTVRAGMEDPVEGKVESKAVGYTISREDVGRWI
ncbi:hypothetical protein B0T16DRAFT_462283 [Cercophora newfieldiana]|uniref:NAD(P)-binding domain-containing protein n=1 Tax=Cercophora newfieldiana TaxID=92897 RepID=A0AA40CHI9_9PEZI|nr:hypothetical protein B0T16DRAFT_462283 [Cercophora newfieldiana]